MNKNKFLKSLYIIIPIVIVAVLGSVFVRLGMPWYENLTKPSEWVPNILIPIVWTIIYLAFGVVLIIWQNKEIISTRTIILLVLNGFSNVLWCLLFFTLKLTLVGNIAILINLIAGYLLLIDIYHNKKLYAYILSIYPIWLSIATTLNIAMWILN
ncbi:MAG: tryptophan-rich sensory protein [Clostridia bacterium]|nr:tryptophan-rich sensory protein [Clostridia bacterium]